MLMVYMVEGIDMIFQYIDIFLKKEDVSECNKNVLFTGKGTSSFFSWFPPSQDENFMTHIHSLKQFASISRRHSPLKKSINYLQSSSPQFSHFNRTYYENKVSTFERQFFIDTIFMVELIVRKKCQLFQRMEFLNLSIVEKYSLFADR